MLIKKPAALGDQRKMKINEILNEDATAGATSAGSIASVAMPLGSGEIIRRSVYGETTTKPKKKKVKK